MIMKFTTRKLNYLDEPIALMKSLLHSGKKETARHIKSVLLQICKMGHDYPDMIPAEETKNMYHLHVSSTKSDGPNHPGYRISIIIMENHILVTSLVVEYC